MNIIIITIIGVGWLGHYYTVTYKEAYLMEFIGVRKDH